MDTTRVHEFVGRWSKHKGTEDLFAVGISERRIIILYEEEVWGLIRTMKALHKLLKKEIKKIKKETPKSLPEKRSGSFESIWKKTIKRTEEEADT